MHTTKSCKKTSAPNLKLLILGGNNNPSVIDNTLSKAKVMQTSLQLQLQNQSQAMKDMISLSLYAIAYIRNMFDDDHFLDEVYEVDTGSIPLKRLNKGISKAGDCFIDAIEQGIFQGIDDQFIKGIQLGVSLDEDNLGDLIEAYLFEIDYDASIITINHEKTSITLIRKNIQQIIRKLIIITQTFDPLPTKRFISIKLLFNHQCPIDYQPPMFDDASNQINEIFIDNNDDYRKIGNVKFDEREILIRVISNVGKTLDKYCVKIDPFDLFANGDASDLHHPVGHETGIDPGSTFIDFNDSINKLSLNKYLPPNSQFNTTQNLLDCECGLHHRFLDRNVFKCTECNKLVHGFCYNRALNAKNKGSPICITCRHQLIELEDLLTMRAMYKIIFMKATELNKEFDLNNERIISIINFFYTTKTFTTVSDIKYNKKGKPYNSLNSIIPVSSNIVDDYNIRLLPGKKYNFIFTPTGARIFNLPSPSIARFLHSETDPVIKEFNQLLKLNIDLFEHSSFNFSPREREPVLASSMVNNWHMNQSWSQNPESPINSIKRRKMSIHKTDNESRL